jgi:AsmA protein
VFDDIKGRGDVNVTLGNQKPFVKAKLALDGLDLRPYMASYSTQNPTGKIQPWTEAPFNVAPLKAVNADFTFTTSNVTLDRLSLQETNMEVTLRDGLLDTKIPALSLYGGEGTVTVSFDAAQAKPAFNMTASLDDVQGNSFLTAIAGFTNATGIAETTLTLSSAGLSQAEIMQGLNGEGLFSLSGGEIKGIDATEFLTGLDQAFKTRALPSGIGATKSTPFNEIKGLFSINNGVVTINDFDLSALNVAASGGGTIDLGKQNIDFRFRPRLNGENAKNIASFGIPLQFSGGFGSATPKLDTQFLTQIVAERAKAEAASRLKDQVKGPVGDILGGLLGGSTQADKNKSEDPTNSAPQTTPKEPSVEQEITNVLGGLLGNKTTTSEAEKTPKPEDEAKPKEEKKDERSDLEKALGGLFGE